MSSWRRALPLAASLVVIVPAAARAQATQHEAASITRAISARIDTLLRAYGHKDLAAIMAAVDSQSIAAFGTDSSEVRYGRAAFAQQMREDFALWDSTSFGALRDVDVQVSGAKKGAIATALFAVPADVYAAGGHRAHLLLRFATTWRRRDAGWRLVQEMSAVATTGQSATDLRR